MNKKLPLPKKLDDTSETLEAVQELNALNMHYSRLNEQLNEYAQTISKQNDEIEQLKLDNAKLINTMNTYDLTLGKQTTPPLHFMERIAVQSPFVVNRFRVSTGWIYTFQTPTGLTSVLETNAK